MDTPVRALALALVLAGTAGSVAWGQDVCRTPTCTAPGTVPALCANRATPRTPTVTMGGPSGLVFVPPEPRIEPGSCVMWTSESFVHTSSDATCPDDGLCNSPSPPACLWDTGNVDSGTTEPTVVCHYDPVAFPADVSDPFYCRIHASPTVGTMRGTLRVTSSIDLVVRKDGPDVLLEWTGGGVPGDETFKIVRSDLGDPAFPPGEITTFDPDGGSAGRSFRDLGEAAGGGDRFYLARNKQANE